MPSPVAEGLERLAEVRPDCVVLVEPLPDGMGRDFLVDRAIVQAQQRSSAKFSPPTPSIEALARPAGAPATKGKA